MGITENEWRALLTKANSNVRSVKQARKETQV